jgi:hypothetical protein
VNWFEHAKSKRVVPLVATKTDKLVLREAAKLGKPVATKNSELRARGALKLYGK